MTTAEILKSSIETRKSPMHVEELCLPELNDRLGEYEGRFGWLTPHRVFDGTHTKWHAPVCSELIEQQVQDFTEAMVRLYFGSIGYWLHGHTSLVIDGVSDFTEREDRIVAELLNISPGYLQMVSEMQLRILDKEQER